MRSLLNVLCLLTAVGCAQPLLSEDRPAPSVRVDGGLISGVVLGEQGDIRAYRGVPFAAPPNGALRWKPPQAIQPWKGIRACARVGPFCPQPKPIAYAHEDGQQSEDCLYLNVWTPATNEQAKLPVMFWIHGGGYTTGSGGLKSYDGELLSRSGVVVVTINYRLGPFGFFAHPLLTRESEHGSSGNYGLLDQIAALQWVQRNITAFGGNPDCVMIFGESAGSGSVARLMVTPLAKGLFQRALCQSGGPIGQNRRLKETVGRTESAEAMGERLTKSLGCDTVPDVLAALRSKTPEEILAAANPAQGLFGKGMKFAPVVDGWVLPDDPGLLWEQGRQHPVPFITGSNADEGTIFLRQLPVKRTFGYRLILRSMYGTHTDEVLKLFPAEQDADVPEALNKLTTVAAFAYPAREMVRWMERIKQPSGLYCFTRVPKSAKSLGAFHGLEIAYIFGNVRPEFVTDEKDRKLSETMRAYWVNFARTGNPNGPGLPTWPIYCAEKDQHLELGDKVEVKCGLYREACDLLATVQQERRGKNQDAASGMPADP